MASEAEIERLYQLFVTNGGGSLSFSGTNLTPKQYSEAVSASNLTPLEMAQLEARQHQYNRQAALNSIADEIAANNFSNPYAARGAYGNSLFTSLASSAGAGKIGDINTAFSGFSDVDKALIFAGVLSQTGIDLEKFLKIAGLSALGIGMYNSLTNHTNNQTANIPSTMQDASSLASMNEQFGEQGDPCSFFNQLMGLLAGVFDGTLDFIDQAVGDITTFLNDSGIISLLTSIYNAIIGAGSVVVDIIAAIVGVGIQLLGGIIGLVAQVINAIADITTQIASEILALADMAAELLRKALALILGAAATDPCKRNVLTNTGTTVMKDAVTQLNKPLGSGPPHMIGTTTDNRANADEVKREMKYSRDEAKLNPGVPQSPLTDAAKENIPKDETIHTKIYQSNYTIEGQKVTATEFKDYKKFTNGKMTEKEEIAYRARFAESDLSKNSESSIKLPVTSPLFYEAKSKWLPKQKAYIQSQGSLMTDLNRKILVGIFETKEQKAMKTRLQGLYEELGRNFRVVKNFFTPNRVGSKNKNFAYYSKDGKVDKNAEDIIKHNWKVVGEPEMQRKYDSALKTLAETKIAWESIKDTIYDDSDRVEWWNSTQGISVGVTADLDDF
jgi:hypothetical protein